MRTSLLVLTMLVALSLQACSNVPVRTTNENLSSLPLFAADARPQFVADLVCSARDERDMAQCLTVSNAFYAWANARHIRFHSAKANDEAFSAGQLSAQATGKPYRVAIRFQPFSMASELAGTSGTYISGEVGYTATIYVFDGSTGALVRTLPMQSREDVPEQANVTEFVEADAYRVIARIDPGYSP